MLKGINCVNCWCLVLLVCLKFPGLFKLAGHWKIYCYFFVDATVDLFSCIKCGGFYI